MTCWLKLESPAAANFKCQQEIHVTPVDTSSRRIMKAQRDRHGVPENICGRRATHTFGDTTLCQSHAAQLALKQMLEKKDVV
jgi:hypothetical protein